MGDDFSKEKKPGGQSWMHLLFAGIIFALVFCYPWHIPENWGDDDRIVQPEYPWQARKNWRGHGYFMMGDSHTYVLFKAWTHPWHSHRTVGYPAFLYPFLYPDHQKFDKAYAEARKNDIAWWAGTEKPIYSIIAENGLAKKLETVALVQRWLLSLAIVVFYLALIRWFPPFFSFLAMTAALYVAPPPDPQFIMTEPLSCALTYLCGASLLCAPKSRRPYMLFALACLCASLAYLVRPQMISLTALCSLTFLYEMFVAVRKRKFSWALCKPVLAFCPLLLAYGYISWISVLGGHLFLHTIPTPPIASFCYLAESEDAKYMPTERARKLTAYFGEHKAEFRRKINEKMNDGSVPASFRLTDESSAVRTRAILSDMFYYFVGMPEVRKHFKDEDGLRHWDCLHQRVLGMELTAGLWHRHAGEILASHLRNILGVFGYYKDAWWLPSFPDASFAINCIALAFIGTAIIVSIKARWPVLIISGIHILTILVPVFGHTVQSRFVSATELFLLLAGMCSLWSLYRYSRARLGPEKGAAMAEV